MFINEVLSKINRARYLGSGDQCYSVMYAVTRAFQVKKIIEIGTHQAASTITMCQAVIDNGYVPQIYTVDNWKGETKSSKLAGKNFRDVSHSNIEDAGFTKYIKFFDGDSKIVLPELVKQSGKVDLCFIDGSHIYEDVVADFNNCKNYVDIIMLHDTGAGGVGYLREFEKMGWKIVSFPTRYVEGNGHRIGISLAHK